MFVTEKKKTVIFVKIQTILFFNFTKFNYSIKDGIFFLWDGGKMWAEWVYDHNDKQC